VLADDYKDCSALLHSYHNNEKIISKNASIHMGRKNLTPYVSKGFNSSGKVYKQPEKIPKNDNTNKIQSTWQPLIISTYTYRLSYPQPFDINAIERG
jgi:hypothetical protein